MKLFHQYTGFFGEPLNHALYELAVGKNDTFSLSRTSDSRYYPEWRKSKVIYDSQFSHFKEVIEDKIRERLDEIRGILGMAPFEIAGFEVQLTSHNDGDYFKWHKDNSTPDTASRLITFVYYFHALPRPFTGGELVIHDGDDRYVIEPANDSIVFFHSGSKHEVRPVVCPSRLFKDGRFTLNGWVRTRGVSKSAWAGNDLSRQIEKQLMKAFFTPGAAGGAMLPAEGFKGEAAAGLREPVRGFGGTANAGLSGETARPGLSDKTGTTGESDLAETGTAINRGKPGELGFAKSGMGVHPGKPGEANLVEPGTGINPGRPGEANRAQPGTDASRKKPEKVNLAELGADVNRRGQ